MVSGGEMHVLSEIRVCTTGRYKSVPDPLDGQARGVAGPVPFGDELRRLGRTIPSLAGIEKRIARHKLRESYSPGMDYMVDLVCSCPEYEGGTVGSMPGTNLVVFRDGFLRAVGFGTSYVTAIANAYKTLWRKRGPGMTIDKMNEMNDDARVEWLFTLEGVEPLLNAMELYLRGRISFATAHRPFTSRLGPLTPYVFGALKRYCKGETR
jgi:hypothetical protein